VNSPADRHGAARALHRDVPASAAQIERALAGLRRAETYAACQAIELDAARRGRPAAAAGLDALPAASADAIADAAEALSAACRTALHLMAPEVAETVATLIDLGAKAQEIERHDAER
jgi:methionine synthase II (cobalamin-independent)